MLQLIVFYRESLSPSQFKTVLNLYIPSVAEHFKDDSGISNQLMVALSRLGKSHNTDISFVVESVHETEASGN